MKNFISAILVFPLIIGILTGCDKSKEYDTAIPPSQANFANKTSGNYRVTNSDTSVYKIPVGVTALSNTARTVNISITSPTGATAGVQYSTNSTVTIAAGQATDTLRIHGIYAGYTPITRTDTLVVTLSGGDIPPSAYNNSFTLVTHL